MRTLPLLAVPVSLLWMACAGPKEEGAATSDPALVSREAADANDTYPSVHVAEDDLQAKLAGRTLTLTQEIVLTPDAEGSLSRTALSGRFASTVHVQWSDGTMDRALDDVLCDVSAAGERRAILRTHATYTLFPTRAWVKVHAVDAGGDAAAIGFEVDAIAEDDSGVHLTCAARTPGSATRYYYEM